MKAKAVGSGFDYSLYLVTDRILSGGRSNEEIVGAAVRGGVTCLQLREKHCSTREFINEARKLNQLLCKTKIPLIINDRLDVALAIGADGVHLGQSDMYIEDARRLVGKKMIIGISAENLDVTNIVLDPLMIAQSGDKLLQDGAIDALKKHLIPMADIITPNLPEASVLLGREVQPRVERLHPSFLTRYLFH